MHSCCCVTTLAFQGAAYAHEQWLLALQVVQGLLLKSQAALNNTADKFNKSGMSPLLVTQLGGTSAQQQEQRASLRQLRQLRNDTVKDVAASLARRFKHGMDEHEMHTEEVRQLRRAGHGLVGGNHGVNRWW